MHARRKRNKIISEINVTPFVDVMLVLLVVFMIISPMMTPGLQVDLPKTTATAISGEEKAVTITISNKGNIYIYDKAIDILRLKKEITAKVHDNKEARIFIRADKNANYGKVVKVIDMVKNFGFTRIALITDYEAV